MQSFRAERTKTLAPLPRTHTGSQHTAYSIQRARRMRDGAPVGEWQRDDAAVCWEVIPRVSAPFEGVNPSTQGSAQVSASDMVALITHMTSEAEALPRGATKPPRRSTARRRPCLT